MSRGEACCVVSTTMLLVLATACAETHEARLVPCEAGEGRRCTPENLCEEGVWQCWSDGEELCVPTGLLPAGAPCDVGLACDDVGSCSVCTPEATCDTGEPCIQGEIDCTTGAPLCVVVDPTPRCPETLCGMACDTGEPCETGEYDCSAGEPTCVGTPLPMMAGCGPGLACSTTGCDVCVEGQTCDTGNSCTSGQVDCSTTMPVCLATDDLPAGTPCDIARVCDGMGGCVEG